MRSRDLCYKEKDNWFSLKAKLLKLQSMILQKLELGRAL